MSSTNKPPSRIKTTIMVYITVTGILLSVIGIVLLILGKIPSQIAGLTIGILSILVGFITFILTVNYLLSEKEVFGKLWQDTHRLVIVVSVVTVSLISVVTLLQIPNLMHPAQVLPKIGSTQISQPNLNPTAWQPILRQSAPNCNNPQGVDWYVHSGGTRYVCNSSGGVMEQTTSNYYGEVDLLKVKDNSYDQSNFRLQVDIAFQNPNDPSTWAALAVQSPADISIAGGYIFTLSPDGTWELQQVLSSQSIPTIGQGTVNIDPHRLVQMMVIVQNGVLYAYINGKQVVTVTDSLSTSPSVVGLMVERQNEAPSSLIEYSNFELDATQGNHLSTITKNLTIPCVTCSYQALHVVLNEITVDQVNNDMIWKFTFTNNGAYSCTNIYFTSLQLQDSLGNVYEGQGQATSSWAVAAGQSVQVSPSFAFITTGTRYILHLSLNVGSCINSTTVSNIYQTETFVV